MLPLLEQIAADSNAPSEIRLWAVGAVLRLVDGKAVSSSSMSALLGRYKARGPDINPKPKIAPVDLVVPVERCTESKSTMSPDDALATIRGQRKGN
jgi:hypothetical protein